MKGRIICDILISSCDKQKILFPMFKIIHRCSLSLRRINCSHVLRLSINLHIEFGSKTSAKTLRKINSSDTFILSLLTSFPVVFIAYKFSVNRNDLRLRFLKALNTSSQKVFWSNDGDSSHFENSPSFKISILVFRLNENFIQQLSAMFTCRDGELSNQAIPGE